MRLPRGPASSTNLAPALASAVIATLAGLAFWLPGARRAHGHFPIPLDDTFIHFGFARAAALGAPFRWIPENGYSSGDTSLTYPLALAPGWLVGFRGGRLGVFAAIVAVASIVDLCASLRRLRLGWVAWTAPLVILAVPLLDWSLFSGMETAFLGAVIGRALLAVHRVAETPPDRRAGRQWIAGAWIALLPATRPELAPLALCLAVSVVHAAGSLGTIASIARASTATVAFLGLQAATNRALTGEWAAAGAIRKLLTANPYVPATEVAIEAIKNLAALRSQAFEAPLGGAGASWIVPALCLAASIDGRARRLSIPLLVGAVSSVLLVALNGTARFQNFRYAAPALLLLLVGAVLGAATVARRGALGSLVATASLLVAIVAPARGFARQIDHFARSSANIVEQQVEVADRLAAMTPRPHRVLVGDAGAIPYLSGIGAIDGLGLGGYRGLPFARASVHGVPAVVELLERIPPGERPDVLAIYPEWWPGLADVFGRPIDAVRIDDNVICGGVEKVIYRADWSTLAPPADRREGAVDEIDVGDLVDERAHAYAFPSPSGGWVIGGTHALATGAPRFDAGRVIPEGRAESFTLSIAHGLDDGPLELVARTDAESTGRVRVVVTRGDREVARDEIAIGSPEHGDAWREIALPLGPARSGDQVRLEAVTSAFRDFHLWVRGAPATKR